MKLLSFCCPSISCSIHGISTVTQCTNAATRELVYNIEKLQADWSSSDDNHSVTRRAQQSNIVPGNGGISGHSSKITTSSANPSVVNFSAGNGNRRRLRRASLFLTEKLHQIDKDACVEINHNEPVKSNSALPTGSNIDAGETSSSADRKDKKKEMSSTEILVLKNEMIMRCFQIFVSDVFLRYLPEHIHHYPSVDIIACDIRKLLDNARLHCPVCGALVNGSTEDAAALGHSVAAATYTGADGRLDHSQGKDTSSCGKMDAMRSSSESHDRKISSESGVPSPFRVGGGFRNDHLTDGEISAHVLFLANVADSLSFTLLLEEHGVALATDSLERR